jgi:Tfp pilus assembly ATPase PilU
MTLMDEMLAKLVRENKVAREEATARADNLAQLEKDITAQPEPVGRR